MEIADFDGDGQLDLAVFEGASSGLIGEDDLAEAGGVLEPGSSAGILVYENVWAAPLAAALRRGGGHWSRAAGSLWKPSWRRWTPPSRIPRLSDRRRARARSLQRKEDTCQDFSVGSHAPQ